MTDQDRRLSPSKLEFEERKRISFHIVGVQGLPQSGWQPMASTFVCLESFETQKSFRTEYKKSGPSIVWGENMPIMDLKDSSEVRFEVRSHMLWNRTVLGKTDLYSMHDLMEKQKEAGDEHDSYIELVVYPATPIFSPRKSPALGRHRRSASAPVDIKVSPPGTRLRSSLSPTKTASRPAFNVITLSLRIREIAAKDRNNTLTAASIQRFVEKCQIETLVELRGCTDKLVGLRNTFQADSSPLVGLLDLVLGAAKGVHKTVADPSTRNINQNTVACVRALNGALTPYQNISARQLEKLGENAATLVREMLCGAVSALEAINTFLAIDNAYTRDKFEFKVTAWMQYFEDCEQYLLGKNTSKPEALINKKSRRICCSSHMTAHLEFPKHNMLEMSLPQIIDSDAYNRSSALLVSEWLFSSALRQPSSPTENIFTKSRDNNILCLSGPAESGKTQLVAHLAPWLAEMGCLGGYFTFDHGLGLGPTATLDALPLTLIHQAAAVEPDMRTYLASAFANNPAAAQQALEPRLMALFVAPVVNLVAARLPAGGAWNPLAPLLFIVDGLGTAGGASAGMIGAFAQLMAGSGLRALPPHVRFLLLTRPEAGLEAALRARQANSIYADMEPEVHCVPAEPVRVPKFGAALQAGEAPQVGEVPLAHPPEALTGV